MLFVPWLQRLVPLLPFIILYNMESEFAKLFEAIDSTMKSAKNIKNFATTDEAGFSGLLDQYTNALAALDQVADTVSDDLGNIDIPDDLLGMLSEGKSVDEFN